MIDKDTHDNWKLDNGDDGKHHCDKCDEGVSRIEYLVEVTGYKRWEMICEHCAEKYDTCQRCDRVIVESEYCHDEYCDNCCFSLSEAYDE